jgi:cell division septation protein DedD
MFPEDPRAPPEQPPLEVSGVSKLRDFEKVRERIILRVEPKHIAQWLIAALLLAAVTFVGGYVAGARGYRPAWMDQSLVQRLAPAEPPAAAPSVAAVDSPPPAVVPAQPSPAVAEPGLEIASADPQEQVIAAGDTAPTPTLAAPVGLEPELAARQAAAAPSDPALQPAAPAGSPPPAADLAGPASQVGADVAKPIPPQAAAARTKAAKAGGKAAASQAVDQASKANSGSGDAAEAGEPSAAGQTPPTDAPKLPRAGRPAAGKYVLQIKAFRNQSEADAFAEELRSKGYTVAVSAVEVLDKGQFFRVRMGPFGTLEAARAAQKKLEQAEGHATIILATP